MEFTSTVEPQYWCLRQNPYANTNQQQMRDLIISQNIVTCPFGHLNEVSVNVINGNYNEHHPVWKSLSQDRQFIENMNIGDIVVIPFTEGIKECILARIISPPIYGIDTQLFTTACDGKIQVSPTGEIPFCPVGRHIQIIEKNLTFKDRRVLPRMTLSHIKSNTIRHLIN